MTVADSGVDSGANNDQTTATTPAPAVVDKGRRKSQAASDSSASLDGAADRKGKINKQTVSTSTSSAKVGQQKGGRRRKPTTADDSVKSETSTTATPTQAAQKGNNQGSNTCLASDALQTGSESTGQNGAIAPGQVESKTSFSPLNLINVLDLITTLSMSVQARP